MLAGQARRVRGAAHRGDLARPRRRALRARAAAGRRARRTPWQDPGRQGSAGGLQRDLRLRRRAGRPGGGPARRTTGQPPRGGRPRAGLGRGARVVHPACPAHRVRSVDPGHPRRGDEPRHPLDPAQPVLPGPARAGRARQADPGHDDLGDLRDRGRHRLRQGPHDPAARGGGPAGAQAGVGAHRRPGRPGGRADRLPGGGQAAGRQPRSRGSAWVSRTSTRSARASRSPAASPSAAWSSWSRSSPARTTAA